MAGARPAATSRPVERDRRARSLELDPAAATVEDHPLHASPGEHADPLRREPLAEQAAHLRLLAGKQGALALEDRHLAAKRAKACPSSQPIGPPARVLGEGGRGEQALTRHAAAPEAVAARAIGLEQDRARANSRGADGRDEAGSPPAEDGQVVGPAHPARPRQTAGPGSSRAVWTANAIVRRRSHSRICAP